MVVDNCSEVPLQEKIDISWHPHNRIVREERLGLTHARVRGFNEAQGNIVVLVDDDNVLRPDYLMHANRIARKFDWIGAFGGNVKPRYEVAPPDWSLSRQRMLAVVEVQEPRYALLKDLSIINCAPVGAGMVIRRDIGLAYAMSLKDNPMRAALDRTGDSLVSGGDNDLCYFCQDLGYGTGLFPELQIEHLIPAARLTLPYFQRLAEGMAFSHTILQHLWSGKWTKTELSRSPSSRIDLVLDHYKRIRWHLTRSRQMSNPGVALLEAERRGYSRAIKIISNLPATVNE